ncbi:hypothetical protein KAM329D_04440 [Aeromonas caviae]|nr:hypothetical protein KAM329_45820 [Aeromonas caviae]GJC21463.1 hypothetical protein KAM329D_04440 [Aeromonas caviae]
MQEGKDLPGLTHQGGLMLRRHQSRLLSWSEGRVGANANDPYFNPLSGGEQLVVQIVI